MVYFSIENCANQSQSPIMEYFGNSCVTGTEGELVYGVVRSTIQLLLCISWVNTRILSGVSG